MNIIKEAKDSQTIERVIEIIKNIIKETEKKGTSDVKPHNALLKGELLENIQIKYRAQAKNKTCIMKIYSNATVWEFKKEVATGDIIGTNTAAKPEHTHPRTRTHSNNLG